MQIGKDRRRFARALSLALAVGGAGLPCAVLASQRTTGVQVDPTPRAYEDLQQTLPLRLRPTLHPFAGTGEPFDLSGPGSSSADRQKWEAAASAIERDMAILARCRMEADGCPSAALAFLAFVDAVRGKEGRTRLGEVNRAINLAIRYRSDAARHQADAWASPLATLAAGEGDCEDYAIAKYMVLREAGVSPDDLRLVLVRDTRLKEDHAVLAARLEDRWLVLDNRHFLLLEDRDASNYQPLAAFGSAPGMPQQALPLRTERMFLDHGGS